MRHAWILDVLTDLRTYAENNNLPNIAAAADQTLDVATQELAARDDDDSSASPD